MIPYNNFTGIKVNCIVKNIRSITIWGTPFSFCHHSIYCRSVSRSIFNNYPLAHLLDLGHYSWRIAAVWTETGGLRQLCTMISAAWNSSFCSVCLTCSREIRDWPIPWTETAAGPDCCWRLLVSRLETPPYSSGWTLSGKTSVCWSHSSHGKCRPIWPAADSGPDILKRCPFRSSPPPSL